MKKIIIIIELLVRFIAHDVIVFYMKYCCFYNMQNVIYGQI